jgi:hypothetical protein
MLDTFLQQAAAFGADAWQALSLLVTLAWTWIREQPLWLTLGVGGALKAAFPTLLLVRLWKRRRALAAKPPIAREKAGESRTPIRAVNPRVKTPVQAAADLAVEGLPAIEIARRTGLARDAIALGCNRSQARTTRQDRPVPAVVAGEGSRSRRKPTLVAHA